MNNTVGEQLKAAREARHLSLEQAAQSTFIKVKFLEALENDRLDEMHTAVQARGFLRMYAELLGLPVGPLLDIWDGNPPEEEEELADYEVELSRETEDEPIEVLPPDSVSSTLSEPDRFILDDNLETDAISEATVSEELPLTSAGVFQEIGEVLRKRRETLKITHEDIEKFVHIRPKYLLALEEGRLDDLPSTVQGRGMLTNYSHFLEVDSSALQTRFAEGLQLRRLEVNPPPVKKDTQPLAKREKISPSAQKTAQSPSFFKKSLTPDLLIGGALIILLFGFALWSTFQVLSLRGGDAGEAEAPNISSVLLEETSAPIGTTTIEATVEATSAMALEATQQASTQQAVGDNTAPTMPVEGNQPLNVYVVARQNAWLQVTVGKSVVFNGRVTAGNAYPFSGAERVELVTGNAAALQVFYNDRDLGSLGLNGQVANLVFTLDGIITPTPRFSPTPSITQPATLTAEPTSTPPPATVTPLIPLQ